MKRRQALVRSAAPRDPPCGRACPFRDHRPNAGRRAFRRFTAAIYVPGTVASVTGTIRQAFARLQPAPVQPTEGQPSLVRTDGDPRPPGSPADEAGRAGATPCSVNQRHRLTPPNEQDYRYIFLEWRDVKTPI